MAGWLVRLLVDKLVWQFESVDPVTIHIIKKTHPNNEWPKQTNFGDVKQLIGLLLVVVGRVWEFNQRTRNKDPKDISQLVVSCELVIFVAPVVLVVKTLTRVYMCAYSYFHVCVFVFAC